MLDKTEEENLIEQEDDLVDYKLQVRKANQYSFVWKSGQKGRDCGKENILSSEPIIQL